MYVDAQNLLSDAQALAATGVSTNSIDLGNVTPKRNVGTGEPLVLGVTVDVAADATTGDETYEFQAVTDDDGALGSPTTIASVVIPRALLVAGYKFAIPIPPGRVLERHLGARYVLGGTTPSITVTTALYPASMFSVEPQHYADAVNIA